MNTVTLRLFATLKDLAGSARLSLDLPDSATIHDVKKLLSEQIPALAPALASSIAAVNQEYVQSDYLIPPQAEIAFFPPVSGGDDYPEYFALVEGAVDLNDLTRRIVTPATGAVVLFSGFVRGETTKGGELINTTRLEYEAYEPMAVAKMKQVADEIRSRWDQIQGIAIVQSVGTLEVGQSTVLIACASGHRDAGGFEAAKYGIDRLKEIVPVWKKEIYPDGAAWIEGHYHPQPSD